MRISGSAQYACCVAAATITFAGCNGGGSPSQLDPSGPIKVNAARSSLGAQSLIIGLAIKSGGATAHRDQSRSWMDRHIKKTDLLYVSDNGTDDVYAYSYPKGKLKGTLTGFDAPKGMCVDKAGNVFITDDVPYAKGPSKILEYAHGGTSPIATLSDPAYHPYGCSVDPVTGNLAVTNVSTAYDYSPGDVVIYTDAKGTPTNYVDPDFDQYLFCGYDDKGNLFVDGINSGSAFEFAELPKGSKTLKNVTLNESFQYGGGVQWDGTYVAVGDQIASVIYQFTINGSSGTEVGATPLDGSNYVRQFWIHGGKVVGPDNQGASVKFWNYPAGGTATKTLTGFDYPTGSTVSNGE